MDSSLAESMKGARVDDEHVGVFGVGRDLHAVRAHAAEHDLGIDEVLGATEGNHADFFHNKGRQRTPSGAF